METPLFIAAQQGHTDTLQLLLDLGADKETTNEARRLRLRTRHPPASSSSVALPHCMLWRCHTLSHARACRPWRQEGASALYAALMSGHEAAARLLIRTGVNLEERDVVRTTAASAPRASASARIPLGRAPSRAGRTPSRTCWSRPVSKQTLRPSARGRAVGRRHSPYRRSVQWPRAGGVAAPGGTRQSSRGRHSAKSTLPLRPGAPKQTWRARP